MSVLVALPDVEWMRRTAGRQVAHAFIHGVTCGYGKRRGSPFVKTTSPPTGAVCACCEDRVHRHARLSGVIIGPIHHVMQPAAFREPDPR